MKTRISAFFIFLLLVSCGPRVQTERTTNKDLGAYETFAYLPNDNIEVSGEKYDDQVMNQVIVETITRNLQEEGYELDRDNPDLLVLVSTKIEERRRATVNPRYAFFPYHGGITAIHPVYSQYYFHGYTNFGPFAGYDVDEYPYEEGTVIVYLVDRTTKETVWKGIASENIYTQNSPEAIEELIQAIFEEFP